METGARAMIWPCPPAVFAKITPVWIPHTLEESKSHAKVGLPDSAENTEAAKTRASIYARRIAAPGLHGLGEGVAHVSRDAVALQTNWAGVAKLAERFQEGQHIK